MNKILFVLLMGLSPITEAKNLTLNFGVEPIKKSGSYGDVLTLHGSYDARLNKTDENLRWRLEGGYWRDKRAGGEASFFVGPALGLVVTPWIFHVEVYAGVVWITERDNYLGGPFQFKETVFLGLAENKGAIGLSLSHLSSAGLYSPNVGRQFLTLSAKYEIN